jgi:acyl-CoA reductase-like NAD-dependent aldehyde dehydrogenase
MTDQFNTALLRLLSAHSRAIGAALLAADAPAVWDTRRELTEALEAFREAAGAADRRSTSARELI